MSIVLTKKSKRTKAKPFIWMAFWGESPNRVGFPSLKPGHRRNRLAGYAPWDAFCVGQNDSLENHSFQKNIPKSGNSLQKTNGFGL